MLGVPPVCIPIPAFLFLIMFSMLQLAKNFYSEVRFELSPREVLFRRVHQVLVALFTVSYVVC